MKIFSYSLKIFNIKLVRKTLLPYELSPVMIQRAG